MTKRQTTAQTDGWRVERCVRMWPKWNRFQVKFSPHSCITPESVQRENTSICTITLESMWTENEVESARKVDWFKISSDSLESENGLLCVRVQMPVFVSFGICTRNDRNPSVLIAELPKYICANDLTNLRPHSQWVHTRCANKCYTTTSRNFKWRTFTAC